MRKVGLIVLVCLVLFGGVTYAGELRPLSQHDAARVQELLKSFDPNSYDFHFKVQDAKGQVKTMQTGRALGLANIRQTNTVRPAGGAAASTNTVINLFKTASTNTTINIFKEAMIDGGGNMSAKASTNTTINIFKTADQQQKAQELNQILAKYYTP